MDTYPNGYMRANMFCKNDREYLNGVPLDCLNPGALNREVNFLYEEDCTHDANNYHSWFIFKLPVSEMFDGNQDNIPELAVTFGDKYGYFKASTLAVD